MLATLRRQLSQTVAAVLGINALFATACEESPPMVNAPSFEAFNPHYRVFFNNQEAAVVQNLCQGSHCEGRGQNNIASITMDESLTPITVVVEKASHDPASDGIGWNIRPSHLQDVGIIQSVSHSSEATSSKTISFTVTAPCQVSVELGDEATLSATKETYFAFANLIVAVNPPESTWPRQKPTARISRRGLRCTSADPDRDCVVAQADQECCPMEVAANTDLYFTSRLSKSFRWGDGCGGAPKVIHLEENSAIFLDPDVVVFAKVYSKAEGTGVYGYGVLSNFYMHGQQDTRATAGLVALHRYATIFGPTLMDSTNGNIMAGRNSTVAWTKSFAWEPETDGVTLLGIGSTVHDNFFKVNGDVLKPFQSHTVYQRNVIWHQTHGSAVSLSWGTWRDNQANKDESTKILDTAVIHDYHCFVPVQRVGGFPRLALQASLANYGTLISAQHSMSNGIGIESSPVLIKGFKVEGKVGGLLALSAGYKDLLGKSPWQESDGCGGYINVRIEDMDLSRVRSFESRSMVASCKPDFTSGAIPTMSCLCTTAMGCNSRKQRKTRCRANVWFENLINSRVPGVPKLQDNLRVGDRGKVHY